MTDTPPRSATPEPRTAAGRSALTASICKCGMAKSYHPQPGHEYERRYNIDPATILAIEAEARSVPPSEPPALDVLTAALDVALYDTPHWRNDVVERSRFAEILARKVRAALRPPAEDPA